MPSSLVTTAEAAAILGLTPQSVRNLAVAGSLPIRDRVGPKQQYLFERSDVEALAQERAA